MEDISLTKDIFSVRLVVADFYMEKPILGLDPCYSEFRGKEIKKVPIIRIFGSTAQGHKCCMHVHGVFPYFYIPYEHKEFDSINKAAYQIAINVDKAINISLGQANSTTQHVFKVQLVKGIPFYGYHPSEHQYLKIYMLNPRFVRKAANLLQGGAILNKNFHPHESHVPYILQFMIDYNLYGMSFVHIPMEVVKFRCTENTVEILYENVSPAQRLDCNVVKKVSSSALEVDINSSFILNRFQLLNKTNAKIHTNPGVASIWQDEKIRRQKLRETTTEKDEKIPALEIPLNEDRPNAVPTESEFFHKTVLISKLSAVETLSLSNHTLASTLSTTSVNKSLENQQKRKFNLSKLLQNAVYPEECTQDDHLINASYIENHLTNTSEDKTCKEMELLKNVYEDKADDSVYVDAVTIDEQLVMNLTQPIQQIPLDATLRDQDIELLDILQQLEENIDTDRVDLDSTLAPLTQPHKDFIQTPQLLDKEIRETIVNNLNTTQNLDSDSDEIDEDNLPDYSMVMDNVDDLLKNIIQTNLGNVEKDGKLLPQIDGTDDLLKTPTKSTRNTLNDKKLSPRLMQTPKARRLIVTASPSRSPRTPKKLHKYNPLPLVVTNASLNKGVDDIPATSQKTMPVQMNYRVVSKPKIISSSVEKVNNQNIRNTIKDNCKKKSLDLNKTHITCNLTPQRCKNKDKILKVYTVEDNKRETQCTDISKQTSNDSDAIIDSDNERNPSYKRRKLKGSTANIISKKVTFENNPKHQTESIQTMNQSQNHSSKDWIKRKCRVRLKRLQIAKTNDSKQQENYNEKLNLNELKSEASLQTAKRAEIIDSSEESNVESNMHIMSFYENSFLLQSPSVFSRESSPFVISNNCPLVSPSNTNENDKILTISSITTTTTTTIESSSLPLTNENDKLVTTTTTTTTESSPPSSSSLEALVCITPLQLPPSREEVVIECQKLKYPEYKFQQPFYSNPDDVTKHKEIGHITLHIPGNKLNDLEEYQSILEPNMCGLAAWRRQQMIELGGVEILNRYRTNQEIREYMADERLVIIEPMISPPSKHEAKVWLKAQELLRKKDEKSGKENVIDEDSPIKVKRQKVTMMLTLDDHDEYGSENDFNESALKFTISPATPSPSCRKSTKELEKLNNSPVSSLTSSDRVSEKNSSSCKNLLKRLSLKRHSKRNITKHLQCFEEDNNAVINENAREESTVQNSQSNDSSIGTQTVLAELEKSSFISKMAIKSYDHSFTSLDNTYGFKVALENLQQAKSDVEFTHLTVMTLEVFVTTRGDLLPNPEFDELRCLFYAFENSRPDSTQMKNNEKLPQQTSGYIIVQSIDDVILEGRLHGLDSDVEVIVVQKEVEALDALLGLCTRWDPDIYAGYEIEMSSWGYVIERAKYLCMNIAPLLSRVPTQKMRDFIDEDRDQFTDLDVEMKLCGRILLDVWRLMRSEIALTSYTFENVMYHIMHKRYTCHSHRVLTEWFMSPCSRWIVLQYYLERVRGTLALLDQLDLIGRTSEMAKLIGIQFYEVLSRGSQFRVESMMLRMAKPKNFVPLSPSVQQRAHMRAPEYLPLIMEPLSRFYADPVIVLDFQSLYPSVIIAYNYCFSTCLGRVEHLGQSTPFEFGAAHLRVSPTVLNKLIERDLITISPCGVVFVKSSLREGILPRMLTEILDTRQMVKQSMKLHKNNSALQRVLHSRQLGLKLMANVTYGYTAANFSGRMPAVEVGDSVVAKGRETLERAIKLVESNEEWNVKVVYGDTDSMFVLAAGRNREEAFRIGAEIAAAVTQQNPFPVKLKLEKVYQPCILQTKKRYVGYMYESADQKEPIYEAKGIETVRRDGCPAVAKMLEKVLRILFETADVSQIKRYVCRQFTKLLAGRSNLQDLIFAKEFRGLHGYKPTACVPALELTRKWLQSDPRHIPRRGERVPFVIINGPPGLPLIRLVRHPRAVLKDEGLKINAIYYITKAIIPPLNRCLLLIGADVNEWFANLPRKLFNTHTLAVNGDNVINPHGHRIRKTTISQFFSTANCLLDCGRQTKHEICTECEQNTQRAVVVLQMKLSTCERAFLTTQHICQCCCGRVGDIKCNSLDCPVLFVLETKRRDLQQIAHISNLVQERF